MKVIAILFAILLIGANAQMVEPTPSCSTSTGANSIALKWLYDNGVKINTNPVEADEKYCNGELKTNKSCCDMQSVVDFVKKQNEAIIGKWRSYINQLARIRHKLIKGLEKLGKKMSSKDIEKKMALIRANSNALAKFKRSIAIMPVTDSQVNFLKTWIQSFEGSIQDFKKSGKACFDAMKNARANLLCAVCSGKAATYTEAQSTADVKFRIPYTACTSLVNSCFPIWKFNFGLASVMQYVSILKNSGKGNGANSQFQSEAEVTDQDLSTLKDNFQKCNFTDGALKCDLSVIGSKIEDFYTNFCKLGFVANKENAYTEGDESSTKDIEDGDADEVEKTAGTEEVAKRILQTATTNPNVGIQVSSTGTTFNNFASTTSNIAPSESVDTSKAGDGSNSGKIITVAISMIAAAIALF